VTCREKAAAGVVEGLGVKLSVRQSARRSGELEALSIEGKLSIADLVDPKLKDPAAADRQRIKALLQLTGAVADAESFRDLVSDDDCFNAVCTADVLKCDDPVEMAAKIKRNLEALSRQSADAAEKAEGQALGCKQATDGLNLTSETDADILQAALEDKLAERGRLLGAAHTADAIKRGADEARIKVEHSTPPNVGRAEIVCTEAQVSLDGAQHEVDRLEAEVAAARSELLAARSAFSEADRALSSEKAHAETWAAWQEAVASAENVSRPTEPEIQAAEGAVVVARKEIEKAAIVREAQAKANEADKHRSAARAFRETAESLRDAAKGTDEVLSRMVASDSLTVKNGRLITQHPERGEVFYAERSEGERWKIAIDEAIKRIRELGAEKTALILIDTAWSELDPANKAAIHQYAVEKGVAIVATEATEGELRAEAFANETV
jgi:hypothetical protein